MRRHQIGLPRVDTVFLAATYRVAERITSLLNLNDFAVFGELSCTPLTSATKL